MFNLLNNVVNRSLPVNQQARHITSISAMLAMAANFAMGVAFSLAIISIGYAFIQFAMSVGDPKAVERAHRALLWGVVSALVAFCALAIRVAIINAIGPSAPEVVNELPGF